MQAQVDVSLIHIGSGVLTLDPEGPNPITVQASEEGATLAYSRSVQPIEIDEVVGPVDYYIDGEECTFSITCNEFDVQKLKAAFGHGTITTQAAGPGQPGYDEIAFGDSPEILIHKLEYKVERRKQPGLYIVITLHKVISVSEVESQFTKTAKTGIPLQFRAMADTSKPKGQRLGVIRIENAPAL